MATTPASTTPAGANTAAQWTTAAQNASTAATEASIAQKQAAQSVKYNQNQIALQTEILNDPTSTSAEKAAAQSKINTYSAQQTQAQVALDTATQQRITAEKSYDQAIAEAAKNTDPQAASTPAPASSTPNQAGSSYTTTPPNAPPVTATTQTPPSTGTTNTTSTTVTTTTSTVVTNTAGGSSTTVYRSGPIDTPASLVAKQQVSNADQNINTYSLDPNNPTERKFLDSNLKNGVITQQQYDENLALTAEQRDAKLTQAYNDRQAASDAAAKAQIPGAATVTRQEEPNTTLLTEQTVQTKSVSNSTSLNGAVTGTNVTTETLNGATYQVVTNADGTKSYTNTVTGNSTTENSSDPVPQQQAETQPNAGAGQSSAAFAATDPRRLDLGSDATVTAQENLAVGESIVPQKQVDEFDGIDAQVAANEAAANQSAAESARLASQNTLPGLTASKADTQSQATQQDVTNAAAQGDWRVRLSLAPGAKYLYAADPPGILAPLSATNGVIFPYTPSISVTYAANYDSTNVTHNNYKFQTYNSSAVDAITIGCDFTAQDVYEANYVLAVIHFFRSLTKMFYGQDPGPVPGTPPPLCYLTGLGAFQFDQHPLLIQNFTYTLPTDVDYIAAGSTATQAGVNRGPGIPKSSNGGKPGESRMAAAGVQYGAVPAGPNFSGQNAGTREPTYVPTKISLSITALPVVTRNDISNRFSLKDYATGALLRASNTGGRGGLW